jgi:hypothetical protein
MAEIKTQRTTQSPLDFLDSVEPAQKRDDSLTLLHMFEECTGEKAVMWGTSIVGFGEYHYTSERSSQEGDWPLAGFSPRKQNLTLYVISDFKNKEELLRKLGKHKTSVGCLYINKLSDIDLDILSRIISESYAYKKKTLVEDKRKQ